MQGRERCLTQSDNDSGLMTYVFSPSFFRLVPARIKSSFSVFERARLLLRVFRGYFVYYQTDKDKLVSYCFLKRNYLHKYSFLKKDDVLINPYFVSPMYRGQGLGGKLIQTAMEDSNKCWKTVYAVVKEDNLPSIRTLEKLNFHRIGYSDKQGWSHKLTDRKTHLPIFCLMCSEEQE